MTMSYHGSGTITHTGGSAYVDITLCKTTECCDIKKVVVNRTASGGTGYTANTHTVEIFQVAGTTAPTSGGKDSVLKSATVLDTDAAGILFKKQFDVGQGPRVYASAGIICVKITASGGDGTSTETFTATIDADRIDVST